MFELFALTPDMQNAVLPVYPVSDIGSTLQVQMQKMIGGFGTDNYPPPPKFACHVDFYDSVHTTSPTTMLCEVANVTGPTVPPRK